MNAAAEARCLAAELGCEVTVHPLLEGVVEARGPVPGVWLLAGAPDEIRAEVRRVLNARRRLAAVAGKAKIPGAPGLGRA